MAGVDSSLIDFWPTRLHV